MNLFRLLAARSAADRPVRVAVVGAGKFGQMFLSQAPKTPGLHVAAIADLAPDRALTSLVERVGWQPEMRARDMDEAVATGRTWFTEDAAAAITDPRIEVVVESTGDPAAGIAHARAAFAAGKHVVMVNVEADVLAGPALAAEAARAGVVYSLAYGDQPALVCELVDTLRSGGFTIVAAGKGTKYQPHFHASTPDTVWQHYGLTPERAALAGMNPKMFNSFLDGTKSGIEMAAIANATGLTAPEDGLAFPPCGTGDLPSILRPREHGGILPQAGMVEVISSQRRDGSDMPDNLRWGVYAVFEGETEYVRRCFAEYGVATDSSGRYAALWRPYHFIGLELGVSVASAALRREPTGGPLGWHADVVAVAKRDLKPGEMLDGEGGACVWGKVVPARRSLALGALPIGLANHLKLARPVAKGAIVGWGDVVAGAPDAATEYRRAMEAAHAV